MPYLAIDTHVQRISKRLNLVNEKDNVEVIENKLNKFIPDDKKVLFNHQLISFGRNICKAKNPMCENCKISSFCSYFKNKVHQ